MPKIGDHVVFVDPVGVEHEALVTQYWGQSLDDATASLNLVYVDGDESKTDNYGRQIARNTSVVHQSKQTAHGMFWREP